MHDLKEKTKSELAKQREKLKKENDKLKDIPDDVVKYITPKDISSFEQNISGLENKILAIDELIGLETENRKVKKIDKKEHVYGWQDWD